MTIDTVASAGTTKRTVKARLRKNDRREHTAIPQNAIETACSAAGEPESRSHRAGKMPASMAISDEQIAASEVRVGIDSAGPPGAADQDDALPISADNGTSATAKPVRQSKKAQVLGLLQRTEGASIAELIAATGWQAHTVRAFLTGVRKDGKTLIRTKDDASPTRYRIAAEA